MSRRMSVDVAARVGDLAVEVRFEEDVAFTALFGPSGAGKTTTLDLIAGLRRPARGRIAVGDTVFVDTERRVFVPPERRRVGYVFQDARLFPHLTVQRNLEYGRPRGARRMHLQEVAEVLGLAALLTRRPATLSGGERQRVALGRALLSEPDLLVMDEPLASLDLPTRLRLLVYLKSVHAVFALPILYVSHDLTSVINFTDRMVYLEGGRVRAVGTPPVALARASGAEVEGLVENTFEGRVAARHEAAGTIEIEVGTGELGPVTFVARDDGGASTGAVVVTFPASEAILMQEAPGKVSTRNVFRGRVVGVEALGPRRLVRIAIGGEVEIAVEVVPETVEDLALAPGGAVHVLVKAASVQLVR